jgi:hypothetical protein
MTHICLWLTIHSIQTDCQCSRMIDNDRSRATESTYLPVVMEESRGRPHLYSAPSPMFQSDACSMGTRGVPRSHFRCPVSPLTCTGIPTLNARGSFGSALMSLLTLAPHIAVTSSSKQKVYRNHRTTPRPTVIIVLLTHWHPVDSHPPPPNRHQFYVYNDFITFPEAVNSSIVCKTRTVRHSGASPAVAAFLFWVIYRSCQTVWASASRSLQI